jgi:hypothetical protein
MECLQNLSERKWTDAGSCADRLKPFDKGEAADIKAKATAEVNNMILAGKLDEALSPRVEDLMTARKLLKGIGPDSCYRPDYEKRVADLQNKIIETMKGKAEAFKRRPDCKQQIATLIQQTQKAYGAVVADEVAQYKCETVAVNTVTEHPGDHPEHPGGDHTIHQGSAAVPQPLPSPPPAAPCDAKDLEEKGTSSIGAGQYAAAIPSLEKALNCKGVDSIRITKLAFMASCKAHDVTKARKFWGRLNPQEQAVSLQFCLHENIKKEELEPPK